MKRDTRQAILNTAQALFREKGYNAVSVGEIAAALGISKGNLTYYFKRKEEIVEALLEGAASTFPTEPPRTLEDLDACLQDMERAGENNAFYFRSHAQLGQLSEKIRARQQEVYRRCSGLLRQGLANLTEGGLLRREAFPGEQARAADTVFLTAVYWLPFCESKGEASSFRTQAWGMLCPLLTDRGRAELAALLPGLFAPSNPRERENDL